IVGHTAAFTMPTTRPASSAAGTPSMSNPGRIAASRPSAAVLTTTITTPRDTTWRRRGRSLFGRMVSTVLPPSPRPAETGRFAADDHAHRCSTANSPLRDDCAVASADFVLALIASARRSRSDPAAGGEPGWLTYFERFDLC